MIKHNIKQGIWLTGLGHFNAILAAALQTSIHNLNLSPGSGLKLGILGGICGGLVRGVVTGGLGGHTIGGVPGGRIIGGTEGSGGISPFGSIQFTGFPPTYV